MEAFLVRVWTPGGGERLREAQGTAVHLRSGRQIAFSEPTALINFLVAASIRSAPDDLQTPDPEEMLDGPGRANTSGATEPTAGEVSVPTRHPQNQARP